MKCELFFGLVLLVGPVLVIGEQLPDKAAACIGCHGHSGVSTNPAWPNLAGQNTGYLIRQLQAFRGGSRSSPEMEVSILALSDQDIREIAAYFASQKAVSTASGRVDRVAKGQQLANYCITCHGWEGKSAPDIWPNLAGQHAPYLLRQMNAYKYGDRESPIMQFVLRNVDDSDLAYLAYFFSQVN